MSILNNTIELQALLNKANALPDKGSGGIDTSDATITPETVFLNEIGYANGNKVTGTFTIENEVAEQESLIAQIVAALEDKAAGGESSPGGTFDTCTLENVWDYNVHYTTVENGQVVNKISNREDSINVLCGSIVFIEQEDEIIQCVYVIDGAGYEILASDDMCKYAVIKVSSEAGASGYVSIKTNIDWS